MGAKGFRFILIACLFWGVNLVGETPDVCEICGERPPGKLYLMTDRIRSRQVILCDRCARLTDHCDTCRLPVFKNFTRLADGRLLCQEDANEAVLDQASAIDIFNEVKRDLFGMMSGLGFLPDRNIETKLVDQKELARIFAGTPGAHPDGSLQGVTRSRRYSKDTFEHQIFLCIGLSRARLAAVAAHEYAHAWIHENRAPDRILDRDTEEAFCELTAFHLMRQRGVEREITAILQNTYTRGKIDILVKASENYQFYRVAEWVKSGKDETLEAQGTHRVAVLQDTPLPLFSYVVEARVNAPDTLRLTGLSSRALRRFALVNGVTFCPGEQSKVRVGTSNVLVHCEEILDQSVILRVGESTNRVELHLR